MSVTLKGLKPISVDDWDNRHQLRQQTTRYTHIELNDERRPTIRMSAHRHSWLREYVDSVAPGLLSRRYAPPSDDDDPYFEGGRFHEQDCMDVVAVLDIELATERPEAYCRNIKYSPEHQPRSPLDVEHIRAYRDFLALCGGYGRD